MRVRVEAGLGIGILLVLQLLVSAWSIGVLVRMTPAIGEILQDNVASEQAVEVMLTALVRDQPADHAVFRGALELAKSNVTEPAEPALLQAIEARQAAAFAGDPRARTAIAADLAALSQVNRDAMRRADRRARRFGQAGAWTAALLGVGAFGLGLLVYRRLRLRLELPVEAIRDTLERVRAGDPHRRCHALDAPLELRQIATDVNLLLDRRAQTPANGHAEPAWLRPALNALLDREPQALALLTADGAVLAANHAALDAEGVGQAGWAREPVAGTDVVLVRRG